MLTMTWRDGTVTWTPEGTAIDGGVAQVERVLSRPAKDFEPDVDLQEGRLGDAQVTLEPGTQRHARAALRTLPGAVVLIDDDET